MALRMRYLSLLPSSVWSEDTLDVWIKKARLVWIWFEGLGSATSVPAKLKIFSVHKTTHIPNHTMPLLCSSFVFVSSQFYLPKTVGADCTWACRSSPPWPRWWENSTRRWRQDGRRGSMWERLPPPVLRRRERERKSNFLAGFLFIYPSILLTCLFLLS